MFPQLALPPADSKDPESQLPLSLDLALAKLESDSVLVEALGKDFVKHFAYVKRIYEIKKFENWTEEKDQPGEFNKEYDYYFYNA